MPPSGRVLLDTNIIIALFAADPGVLRGLGQAESVYLPVIALGELFYGALHSSHPGDNIAHLQAFAAAATVLPCDPATATAYGEIKALLRRRGTPIPENDIWIAAIAHQHSLSLASRDAHFALIPGLDVLRWEGTSSGG